MALSDQTVQSSLHQCVTGYLEILFGREAVDRRLIQLIATARQVCSVLPRAVEPLEQPQAAWWELLSTRKHTRALVEKNTAAYQAVTQWIAEHDRPGLDLRVHVGPALCPMLVLDEQVALMSLDPSDACRDVLLCKGALAASLRDLFEALWSRACPQRQAGEPTVGLSARERRIAALLLAGATDEQTAVRLGVSARTVRTVVARLQQRYGTNSRMALGFRLACSEVFAEFAQRSQQLSPQPFDGEMPYQKHRSS